MVFGLPIGQSADWRPWASTPALAGRCSSRLARAGVLLVSGVARFSGTATDPGITRAVEAIQQMAGPGTLSEAADGTFIRDTFYGATGVPLPLLPRDTLGRRWADRARLI